MFRELRTPRPCDARPGGILPAERQVPLSPSFDSGTATTATSCRTAERNASSRQSAVRREARPAPRQPSAGPIDQPEQHPVQRQQRGTETVRVVERRLRLGLVLVDPLVPVAAELPGVGVEYLDGCSAQSLSCAEARPRRGVSLECVAFTIPAHAPARETNRFPLGPTPAPGCAANCGGGATAKKSDQNS